MEVNITPEDELKKIADFINSPAEASVDTDEIENTIDYINTEMSNVKTTNLKEMPQNEIKENQNTINEITNIALNTFGKVDSKTDEIYDLFYKPLYLRQDRSDASKQALIESQRLKIEMINALANLANANAKLEAAKQKSLVGSNGVVINAMSGHDANISIQNLWEEVKREEGN